MVQVASGLFLLRGNWSGRSSLIGEVRRRLPGSPWSAAPCGRRRELRARRVSSARTNRVVASRRSSARGVPRGFVEQTKRSPPARWTSCLTYPLRPL